MNLTTPITLPASPLKLDGESKVMLIGSCFAQEVGSRLQTMLGEEQVEVNPFGVQYNPLSIERVLRLLMKADKADAAVFEGRDGIYHSWFHTSHFSADEEAECRDTINNAFCKSKDFLKQATCLIITFGTTRCYRLNESGLIVSNCHKEPQSCFTEVEPSLGEMMMQWRNLIDELRNFNPDMKVLFTVSPYRYRKYGFHESQLQKAKLLMLVDDLQKAGAAYFPSYEIMLDELRDYRFYANDMLHPSDLAVDIITERFCEWTFTPELTLLSKENIKAQKRKAHRQIKV